VEELEGLLGELKALEIIYEQGLLPEPAYIFKHAVIQDVAYQSLLVQRRKELHRAVGEAIEELYRDRLSEHYAELAHHFIQGEQWAKAIEYSTLAGDRAAGVFANEEAKKQYSDALEAASKLAPPPEWEALFSLQSKYGEALLNLSEYDAAAAEYMKALELARRVGDRRREMEMMVEIASAYDYGHRGEPAIDYNERALAIARELNDREFQAVCLANRVAIRTAGWGDIVETAPDAEEALRLSEEIKNEALLAKSLVFVGGALQWRGDFERGLVHLMRTDDSRELPLWWDCVRGCGSNRVPQLPLLAIGRARPDRLRSLGAGSAARRPNICSRERRKLAAVEPRSVII